MPTYMDRHDNVNVTPEELAGAHALDLEVQAKHGVSYLSYWYDPEAPQRVLLRRRSEQGGGRGRAPRGARADGDPDHRGRGPDGRELPRPASRRIPPGEPYTESAFRTILFTDIVGSTDLTQRLGDAKAMELVRTHDAIVRRELAAVGGNEVKHTGDGIMASFASVARSIECAIAIQRTLEAHSADAEHPIRVRIGVSAGEPVAEARRPVRRRRPTRRAGVRSRRRRRHPRLDRGARALRRQRLHIRIPRRLRAQRLQRAHPTLRSGLDNQKSVSASAFLYLFPTTSAAAPRGEGAGRSGEAEQLPRRAKRRCGSSARPTCLRPTLTARLRPA